MERHPRRTEPLVISPRLSALLARLRATTGTTSAAELDVDKVRDIEAGVGCRLPDPVLAILAAAPPALAEGLSLELGQVLAHTRRAREARARGDLVCFGADPDGFALHGFLIGAPDERVAIFETRRRELGSLAIEDWLAQQAPRFCPRASEGPDEGERVEARLVRRAREQPEGPRVRHKKWGVGRLLKEEGRGEQRKVKVAFPEVGLKTINARFVEFL